MNWTKDFLLAFICRGTSSSVFSLLTTTFASYMFVTCTDNTAVAGAAVGIYIVAALLSRLISGRYMDLVGRRRLFLVATGAFFVFQIAYVLPMPTAMVFALRFAHGFAFGIVHNTLSVIVLDYLHHDHWGEGLSVFTLSSCIAQAAGPFLGIWILSAHGFFALFAAASALAGISFWCACLLRIKPHDLSPKQRAELTEGFRLRDFVEISALPVAGVALAMNLCSGSVSSFVNTYLTEIGLAPAASWYFLAYAFVMFVTRPFMGKFLDTHGGSLVLLPSIASIGIGCALLALCGNVPVLIAAACFMGFGVGNTNSSSQVIAVLKAPSHRSGTAMATITSSVDAGMGLGPMILGASVPLAGYSGMLYLCVAISALALAAFGLTLRKMAESR